MSRTQRSVVVVGGGISGLAIAHELCAPRGEGTHLGNLGLAYADLGQVERAIEHFQQALTITREIHDASRSEAERTEARSSEGRHLGNLGLAYAALGQIELAIEHYQKALAIAQEFGDRRAEALRSWNLGLLYEDTDPTKAVELMFARVAYELEIGHPDAEVDAQRVAQIRARLET